MNQYLKEDLIRLRDELVPRAFSDTNQVINATLAEVVLKINSCLYKGYPRRHQNTVESKSDQTKV